MTRSSNNDLSLILDWIANAKSYDAWEDLNALVDRDPEEAWSFVRDMIDVAPPALLGAIAAGPLEDLLHKYGNLLGDRILEAARTDAALHECLGGVYEPEPLATRIQEVLAQPPIPGTNRRAESLTKERFARIARWFHQSDTMWASSHLGDMIHTDPQAAWRLLLDMVHIAKDEHPDVLHAIEVHVFGVLVEVQGEILGDQIVEDAGRVEMIRQWIENHRGYGHLTDPWIALLRRYDERTAS